jgi:hypothetical protein
VFNPNRFRVSKLKTEPTHNTRYQPSDNTNGIGRYPTPGLSQKTNLCQRHEILFSFLKELKKENIYWQSGATPVF